MKNLFHPSTLENQLKFQFLKNLGFFERLIDQDTKFVALRGELLKLVKNLPPPINDLVDRPCMMQSWVWWPAGIIRFAEKE